MIGKAVKLAEGFLDTHSKKVVMNKGFLQDVAKEAKCEEATVDAINRITLARELWELLTEKDQNRFFPLLLQKCKSYCAPSRRRTNLAVNIRRGQGLIPILALETQHARYVSTPPRL